MLYSGALRHRAAPAGAGVSITTHWRSAMMASAARDPVWQAKVASETARTPALAALDGVSCTLCHQIEPDNLGEKAGFSGGYTIDGGAAAARFGGYYASADKTPVRVAAIEPVQVE